MLNFVECNNIVLHYHVDGLPLQATTKPPLVFLNSLGSDLRIWDALVPAFAPEHPILRYDLRGHGLSDAPPGPYTIRMHTRDLADLLARLRVTAAILIGVSVGGMIALDYAANYQPRVAGLVLCDTGAKIGTPDYWATRIAAVRAQGLEPLAETILQRWFSSDYATNHPAAYRGYRNMLTRTPLEGYAATCEALRDADLRLIMKRIQMPSLVLCGDEDLATPPALGRELAAALPQARFALVPGAGHIPSLEQPAKLTALIKEFLEENCCG